MQFDYTTLGHVTVDVLADGSRRPGGSAFYSALQAARLGLRARIVTCGVASEIEELLSPFAAELDLRIEPAPQTTTLLTEGAGSERRQRVLAWAGPLPPDIVLDSAILHLAPVARELPRRWHAHARFLGLTPQGLLRVWPAGDGAMALARADAEDRGAGGGSGGDDAGGGAWAELPALARRCDAIVISEHEAAGCQEVIAGAVAAGATVAVTAGAGPSRIISPGGDSNELAVAPVEDALDDLGAGDVFAAAFFIALADGRPATEAGAFANAAAAVRVQGLGPQAVGAGAQIERRMRAAAGRP